MSGLAEENHVRTWVVISKGLVARRQSTRAEMWFFLVFKNQLVAGKAWLRDGDIGDEGPAASPFQGGRSFVPSRSTSAL